MPAAKKEQSMLPEDTAAAAFGESELRVDFSDEELASEGRSYEPAPTGKYPVTITEWEPKVCGPESKNPGKPFWAIRLRVNDGKYEGKFFFANVMLFKGAMYSYVQLAKAIGTPEFLSSIDDDPDKRGPIPHGDKLVGHDIVVSVIKTRDNYAAKRDNWEASSGEPYPMKNEVKGYLTAGQGAVTSGGGSGSLLPG